MSLGLGMCPFCWVHKVWHPPRLHRLLDVDSARCNEFLPFTVRSFVRAAKTFLAIETLGSKKGLFPWFVCLVALVAAQSTIRDPPCATAVLQLKPSRRKSEVIGVRNPWGLLLQILPFQLSVRFGPWGCTEEEEELQLPLRYLEPVQPFRGGDLLEDLEEKVKARKELSAGGKFEETAEEVHLEIRTEAEAVLVQGAFKADGLLHQNADARKCRTVESILEEIKKVAVPIITLLSLRRKTRLAYLQGLRAVELPAAGLSTRKRIRGSDQRKRQTLLSLRGVKDQKLERRQTKLCRRPLIWRGLKRGRRKESD